MRGSVECHTYWPPEGSPDGDGVVVTANGPGGCLLLVRAGPREGTVLPWRALFSSESRDIGFSAGRLIVSEGEDPLAAIVRTFAFSKPTQEEADAFLTDIARWEANPQTPAFARWSFFSNVCGRATPAIVLADIARREAISETPASLRWAYLFGAHESATPSGETRNEAAKGLLGYDQAYGMERVDQALMENPMIGDALLAPSLDPRDPRVEILMSPGAPRRDRIEALAGLMNLPSEHVPYLARLMSLWARRRPPHSLTNVLQTATAAPLDWLPDDRDGILAMVEIVEVAELLSRASKGALAVRELLGPVHGRWTAYRAGLLRLVGKDRLDPIETCSDVADGVAAFREDVVEPVRALARETQGTEPAGCPIATAWIALHGGRGLAAVLEASRNWHTRASTIHDVVSSIGSPRGQRWPTPFQAFVADGGCVVEPMVSTTDLELEAKRQRHCVSTYAQRCASGACAVATIGLPGAKPSDRSTAELRRVEGVTVVAQHRGLSNGNPPSGNVAALGQAIAAIDAAGGLALGGGRRSGLRQALLGALVPRGLRDLPYDPRVPGSLERAVEAWVRHLRRDLRDPYAVLAIGDPAAAAALRARADAARSPRPSLRFMIRRFPRRLLDFVKSGHVALLDLALVFQAGLVLTLLTVWLIDRFDRFLWPERSDTRVFSMVLGEETLAWIPRFSVYSVFFFVVTLIITSLMKCCERHERNRVIEDVVERRRVLRRETGPQTA